MKTLLMSVICYLMCLSLFAQVDSTNRTNNDSSMNSTPTMTPPTMNTTTDTSMNNNQTTPPTMNTDTSGNMNSNNSTNMNSNNSGMNMNDSSMNGNLVNPNNVFGQPDYASLPVLETYVPDNIVAEVKQKHPNEVIYDITAVKAPVDSNMMQSDSMSMNQNSMAMNQSSADSGMNQNTTAMNQSPMTDSSMNQNSTNNSNAMAMNSTMQMPEKFNYVVRVIQGGQLMTETLESDGTSLNAVKSWNQ